VKGSGGPPLRAFLKFSESNLIEPTAIFRTPCFGGKERLLSGLGRPLLHFQPLPSALLRNGHNFCFNNYLPVKFRLSWLIMVSKSALLPGRRVKYGHCSRILFLWGGGEPPSPNKKYRNLSPIQNGRTGGFISCGHNALKLPTGSLTFFASLAYI